MENVPRSDLLVVAYITKYNNASRNLELSLKKYGYKYKFIGLEEKWRGFVKGKIASLTLFLSSIKNPVVCIVDGYDMLASGPPEELYEKYIETKYPIIYGGEKFCFSYNGTPIKKYKNISFLKGRKFVNGGFCIGKREDIISMYEWIVTEGEKLGVNDDQKLIGMYINKYPNTVDIDIYQKIVFNTITTVDCGNFGMEYNRVRIKSFDTFPCFIHFPSSASDEHDRYNTYGRKILGKSFRSLYYVGTSLKFLANIPCYFIGIILIIAISGYFIPIKYTLPLLLLFISIMFKLKVNL